MNYENQISFAIDHHLLNKGIYLSKKQQVGNSLIRTYDLRVAKPYVKEEFLPIETIHAFEHSFAFCLRNLYGDSIIYFGPGGCLTNFYLIVADILSDESIYDIILNTCIEVNKLETVPANTEKECGNCYILGSISDVKQLNDLLKNLTLLNVSLNYPGR